MGAKDSGLPPEQLHDAFVHEVFGHVGVDRRQRVVEEVDVFVLRRWRRETRETPDRAAGSGWRGGGAEDRPCRRLWPGPGGPSVLRSESLRSLPPPSCHRVAKPEDTF